MGRVSKIITKKDGTLPVLVNFENGSISTKSSKVFSCQMLTDVSKDANYLVTESNNILYKGIVENFQNTMTMIAIRNPKKNKVRLIEINKCNLVPTLNEQYGMDLESKSKKEMHSLLNKTFGSKRTKRRTEIKEHMEVNVEEIKEQLQKTIDTTIIDHEDLKMPSANDSLQNLLPPIHREASSIDLVYVLDELVDPTIIDSLSYKVDELLSEDVENEGFTYFVAEKITSLRNSDIASKHLDCCLLLYIDSLIKYFTANYRDISKKSYKPCAYSEVVSKQILNTFSMMSASGRTRPNTMRDKTLAYIIILSLLVCGHIVMVEDISKSLKVSGKKVSDLCNAIGVTQSKIQGKSALVLKLPLPKPSSILYKGKRK